MAQLLRFDGKQGEYIVIADHDADKGDAFYIREYDAVPTDKLEIVAGPEIANWPTDRALEVS